MDTTFYDTYMDFVTQHVTEKYRNAFANIATARLVWDGLNDIEEQRGFSPFGYDHYSFDHIREAMRFVGFNGFLD